MKQGERSDGSNTVPSPAVSRGEHRFYLLLGALTLLLASVPYIYGYLTTPRGDVFTGLIYNIDDSCVYLSWMQQAQAGHFFIHSLFSTDPQKGVLFNLFFWTLGTLVRVTHLPQIAVYHGARVVCGGLFLAAVVRLLRQTFPTAGDARARCLGFALVCASAGLGWLWGGYSPARATRQPIDLWQPEAISFLALYFSPLFAAALALMVVFMTAVVRVEQTGRLRDAVPAMIAGALLGNFHSYDVIPLFTVWFVYRIALDIRARRFGARAWLCLIAVGLAALPTTAYVYWATRVEPVFFQRAFVSATPSPALRWDLLGLGLPLALAVGGAVLGITRSGRPAPIPRPLPPMLGAGGEGESETATHVSTTPLDNKSVSEPDSPAPSIGGRGRGMGASLPANPALFYLLTYLVVGIAVAYVPVAFQRKLLMGVQLPICLLAGYGLAALTARLSGDFPKIVAFFVVLLTIPSNVLFVMADMDRLSQNAATTSHRPYLKQTEIDALDFLRDHAGPTDATLVSPDASSQSRYPGVPLEPYLSVYVPALAGRVVYDGHWSETASYGAKREVARLIFRGGDRGDFQRAREELEQALLRARLLDSLFPSGLGDTPDEFRQAVLKAGGIRYVLCDNRLIGGEPPRIASGAAIHDADGVEYIPVAWANTGPPAYLKRVFGNNDVTIYSVETTF